MNFSEKFLIDSTDSVEQPSLAGATVALSHLMRELKLGSAKPEWLVTDRRGAFAMGSPDGLRFRKYHGFFQGIAGRSETAFLQDLDVECNGEPIWPHRYAAPDSGGYADGASVIYPDISNASRGFSYIHTDRGPRWQWTFNEGSLTFAVERHHPGGIRLRWTWASTLKKSARLKIRPLFAMRPLHHVGGQEWSWQELGSNQVRISDSNGASEIFAKLEGETSWNSQSTWYKRFYYPEEAERGYDCQEDLFSAGFLEAELSNGDCCGFVLAESENDLLLNEGAPARVTQAMTVLRKISRTKLSRTRASGARSSAMDFILTRPAGIVAGFPWFGEWGRDTFISLPGIVSAWLAEGGEPAEIWTWTREVMHRWGDWIRNTGMLPNLIEKGGAHQWESADATLWWCHSVASLWMMSLDPKFPFQKIESEFKDLLAHAVTSIREGRHVFLKEREDGLLEVTEAHTTWMDARVEGAAITPRTGVLPEINALWFQARALHSLWAADGSAAALENLGHRVLEIRETDRPNTVFLHSIPLAPSFVLKRTDAVTSDLKEIYETLWTPVGLRTLSPCHPAYQSHCVGNQRERDTAYHQGAVWAWLGGHFEMAKARCREAGVEVQTLSPDVLAEMPIDGHIPEIFDGDEPFTPRGAPAQAWSSACHEEAAARKKSRLDGRLTRVLAQRWLGRKSRKEPEPEQVAAQPVGLPVRPAVRKDGIRELD